MASLAICPRRSETSSIDFDVATGKFVGYLDGKAVAKSMSKSYVQKKLLGLTGSNADPFKPKPKKFDINTRYEFLDKAVSMVADGIQASLVITAPGGVGKTYGVLETLHKKGFVPSSIIVAEEDIDVPKDAIFNQKSYTIVKGFSTAKAMFRTLYENINSVVVFDDCDAVLKDAVAVNILKAALDSYSRRVISWHSEMMCTDLPRSFVFEGGVIFISNLAQEKIDQALRSRSMMIDLSLTLEEKIERMEFIAKSDTFLPEYDMEVKMDALEFIKDFALSQVAEDINLRSLITVCKVRAAHSDWTDMATYIITSSMRT
jgi:hypothetical protein